MPPYLALLLWLILLVALFVFDPAKTRRVSRGLWVPVIWMTLIGSRSPSQWLGVTSTTALEEGNPLDHVVYLTLTSLALGILMARGLNWRDTFTQNSALLFFALFALLSIAWS